VLGAEPREVAPDGDDPVDPRVPFGVESGPEGVDGDESGPVGRES